MGKDKKAQDHNHQAAPHAEVPGGKTEGHGGGAAPHKKKEAPSGGGKETVMKQGCKADGCNSKDIKFGFCMDHYEMYMAGVIRGDGKKPIDFDKKFASYQQNLQKSRKAA
jgi:hypothetical protein